MIKLTVSISLLLLTIVGNTQRLKLAANFGATIGSSDILKKRMPLSGGYLGYEVDLGGTTSFSVSASRTRIHFDSYDTSGSQVFNIKQFFGLSLDLIKYIKAQKPGYAMFFGVGMFGEVCSRDKRELRHNGLREIQKSSFPGYNVGAGFMVGYQLPLTPRSSLTFAINPKFDLIVDYSDESSKMKFQRTIFSIGFSTPLNKKIG